MRSSMQAAEVEDNIRLARAIADSVWTRHGEFLKNGAEQASGGSHDPAQIKSIHDDLKRNFAGLNILKIKIYQPQGYTVYSSDFSQIGQSKKGNAAFEYVVSGKKPRSAASFREKFTGFDVVENVHVVETYVPITNRAGKVISVFEIYVNVNDQMAGITALTRRTIIELLIGLGVLFSVLVLIVWRADKVLQTQSARLDDQHHRLVAKQIELGKAHDQLKVTNQELERNIAALTEAQREIVEKGKLAQLGQLTATVAHEIRNPLGSVRTATYLLQRKINAEELGVEKQFRRIVDGISRCDGIINQLLGFARRDAFKPEEIEIDGWVGSIVAEERAVVPTKVAIEENYQLDGSVAIIDPAQMRRVLVNLVSNASEAMVGRDGAESTTENPRIVVATARGDDGCLEISVTDNGPGITPDNLARIREPLFTTKSFGVGLGIPAVEKILQAHGGGLRIDTEVGQGTTMTAWFKAGTSDQREVAA